MKRGEIYDARLEPVEGSEQGGTRPVVIVSRDAINAYSPVVLAVPCTTYQSGKKIYPTQVLRERLKRVTGSVVRLRQSS
jgi:mRNA interferase MazF